MDVGVLEILTGSRQITGLTPVWVSGSPVGPLSGLGTAGGGDDRVAGLNGTEGDDWWALRLAKFNARSVNVAQIASTLKRDGSPLQSAFLVFTLSGRMDEVKSVFLQMLSKKETFGSSVKMSD